MAGTMDRRSFMGALGTMGAMGAMGALAAAAPVVAFADEADAADDAAQTTGPTDGMGVEELGVMGDMAKILAAGGTTLTVDELNIVRHKLVDDLGDITLEDGTVIPAVWHKLSMLVDTYGYGIGDIAGGNPANYFMYLFDNNEEDAQNYLDMPWGREFSAYEYATISGKTFEECSAICDDLYSRGLLFRGKRVNGYFYHHLAMWHGFFESSVKHMCTPEGTDIYLNTLCAAVNPANLLTAGSPIYYAVPVDKSIVADERVLPLNDYEIMLDRYDTIAVVPCFCSLNKNVAAGAEIPPMGSEELKDFRNVYDGAGRHLERCLAFGEEAEYFLGNGVGREIDKDEARAIIERSIEEGFVISMSYARNTDILCACHVDCCDVLGFYQMIGPEGFSSSPLSKNASNYLLNYDREACIQCGACVDRCAMHAITMDETGHPEVSPMCVRCGQCGLVCPAGARTLTAAPATDRLLLPDNEMDSHNRKFGRRVECGNVVVPA